MGIASIDPYRLDEEWVGQCELYRGYARKLAAAKETLDEAKDDLERIKAKTNLEVRGQLEKVTEGVVAAAVLVHKEVIVAQEELRKARRRVNDLTADCAALQDRKSALENLVKLHLNEYYAKPKAPEGQEEEIDELEKRAVRTRGRKSRRV